MRIVQLVAGAGGMYCGSCMRDNRLAAVMLAQGRDVVLLPLYTPIRTDERDVSATPVYYGGIGVYLRQKFAFYRRLPALFDRLVNLPVFLRAAARVSVRTSPDDLGALTVSVLEGSHGTQKRELSDLINALREIRPNLIHLPNLMFVGIAASLKKAFDVPILCSLAGEDIFMDALPEPFRARAFDLVRRGADDIDGFIAPSHYYADHSARHFGLPADRVHFVPMGIHVEDFEPRANPPDRPFVIGFLARICPEKGLAPLCDAFVRVRQAGRDCRLRVAGYLGANERPYLQRIREVMVKRGCSDVFEYVGEVSRQEKLNFLRSLHVLSVPTPYVESKGFYVLEAMAAGVPVVQPAHGSFPELIESTGGGLLYDPHDPSALAACLTRLMDDSAEREELAYRGREGVRAQFTDIGMAEKTYGLYKEFAEKAAAKAC